MPAWQNQKTHALLSNMGNTKYEHAVVTARQINNQEVTTDTPLDFIEQNIECPSTSIARANDFNNTLLTTVDFFFFKYQMAHKPTHRFFVLFSPFSLSQNNSAFLIETPRSIFSFFACFFQKSLARETFPRFSLELVGVVISLSSLFLLLLRIIIIIIIK